MNNNNIVMLLDNAFKPDLRVLREAKYINNKGFNVEIICLDRKNEFLNKPNEIYDGIKITRFIARTDKETKLINDNIIANKMKYFIYFIWFIKFIKQVKKYLKNKDFEILHCHDLRMGFCACLVFKNKKIVFDMHEFYSNKKNKILNFFINKIVKYTQKKATWIVHVNDFQVKNVKQKEKLVYVPNYPEKYKFANLQHIPSDKIRISYTGYVRHYVPLLNLMKATNELEGVETIINGEGDSYIRLLEQSKTMKNITFTGAYNHNNISKFYENSDIVYIVYNKGNKNDETAIPTKLYEAIIAKIPIIVGENTAMADFVNKYDIGFTVDGTDYISIKKILLSIIKNPQILREKATNINKISNDFTWDEISKNLDRIYK